MRNYKLALMIVSLGLAVWTVTAPKTIAANYGDCSYGALLFNQQCSTVSGDSGGSTSTGGTTSGQTTTTKSKSKSSTDGSGAAIGTTDSGDDDTDSTNTPDSGSSGHLPDTVDTEKKTGVNWVLMLLGVGAVVLAIVLFLIILSRRRNHSQEEAVLIN